MFGVDHKTRWGGLDYLLRRRAIMRVAEPRGTCLDIGCGDGRYCRELLTRGGGDYVGLDINWASLKNAKATNSNPKAGFIVADARCLPIRSESIDFALATEALEHIENYVAVIDEIRRVIKRRGELVVTVPCLTLGNFLRLTVLRLLKRDYHGFFQSPDHKREFCIIAPFEGLELLRDFKIEFGAKGLAVIEQHFANVLCPLNKLFFESAVLHPERHQELSWLILVADELLARILKSWGNYLILKFQAC